VSLGGGFFVPLPRLYIVVENALAIGIEQAEMVWRDGLPLLDQQFPLAQRGGVVAAGVGLLSCFEIRPRRRGEAVDRYTKAKGNRSDRERLPLPIGSPLQALEPTVSPHVKIVYGWGRKRGILLSWVSLVHFNVSALIELFFLSPSQTRWG